LENDLNSSTSEDLTYQVIVDGIMVELQHKYNIRPRNRGVAITQMKMMLPRSEIDEIVSKNVENQTEKTKITDTQPTKTKVVEIPTVKTQKEKVPTTETKPSPQRKADKKGTEVFELLIQLRGGGESVVFELKQF
jgi:hypothetical protein